MKLLILISLLFFSVLSLPAKAQEQQIVVPYTLADRDRAIRFEAKISALDNRFKGIDSSFDNIDKQFIYIQKQLDELKTILYFGFGILITLMVFMLGYMIWNRYTLMQPALLQAANLRD